MDALPIPQRQRVPAKPELGGICAVFRSGPVFREGCQVLHSPGVLRVTCYFHAIILHFLCFKTFDEFGLIRDCASYMDGMSKCVASDIILGSLDKSHMLAAVEFGSFFKWIRGFSFPLTKLDFVHLGVCVSGCKEENTYKSVSLGIKGNFLVSK